LSSDERRPRNEPGVPPTDRTARPGKHVLCRLATVGGRRPAIALPSIRGPHALRGLS
jgi:hypothetical protein